MWKRIHINVFNKVHKFNSRPLYTYRQKVNFELTHEVDNVAAKLQLGLPTDCISFAYFSKLNFMLISNRYILVLSY